EEVARAAADLCRDAQEQRALEALWRRDEREQRSQDHDGCGRLLKRLREQQGVSRRELADLFGVGGRKPARIIKHIEEDGLYSARAYPAGLVAVLAPKVSEREPLLELWRAR